jgi:hypothetical protein
MIPETNDFHNKCAFVSAYKKVKSAMVEIEEIADPELWLMLDECACKLKQEIDRDKVLSSQPSGHGVSDELVNS